VIDGAHTSASDNKKAVSPEEKLGQSFDAYINDQPIDFTFTAKLKSTWRSPVYTFFKTDRVVVQYDNRRPYHWFLCGAHICKVSTGGVRRYQDKSDKASMGDLRQHACCF
jgi:hypothetical protein